MQSKREWKLLVCVTYYQLILAIQLKLTIFSDYNIAVVLHEGKTKGMEDIYKRMKTLNIFEEIYFFKNEDIIRSKNPFFQIKRLFEMIDGSKDFCELSSQLYDELIFYNVSTFLIVLYAEISKKSPHILTSRLEEGILSYDNTFHYGLRGKISRMIRKRLGRENVLDERISHTYYCTIPDLNKKSTYKLVKIPSFDKNIDELRNILNVVFSYERLQIKEKYIFFSSTAAENSKMLSKENEFVIKLADKVGRDNLLVKMHPRDIRDIYERNGIHTLKTSLIPWEVIQLNLNPEGYILLTATSGAFLNIATSINTVKGYFLFKLFDEEYQSTLSKYILHIENIVSSLHSVGFCEKVEVLLDSNVLE